MTTKIQASKDIRFSLMLEHDKDKGNRLFRIDHKTGQTWKLVDTIWIAIPESKVKPGSEN
jgi:hypothetical protein